MATPVGEDNWLAYVEEQTKRATDLEGRVNVVELFKSAVNAEPASLKIWLAYCEYYWSLFVDCQTPEAGWPEEEQQMGREVFSFGAALSLWSDGYEAIKFRINDSHEFWNRWVSIEMEQLSRTRTPVGVKRITHLFRDRLQIPHSTWDSTSQMFSSFLSEYNNAAYEAEFKEITAIAQPAKEAYAARELRELGLNKLAGSGDDQAYQAAMKDYLDWETIETTIKSPPPNEFVLSVTLALALYSRALTGVFRFDDDVWCNYVVYLSTLRDSATISQIHHLLPDTLNILQRATSHCPGSGTLWSRYILSAEEAGWGFQDVEAIKHAATTNAAALDKNGMPGVIDMYAAWCGYLKRSALSQHANDDAADVAEFGLVSAIEDVGIWGRRLYKEEYQGDPNYRVERILIQFLTEKRGDIDGARSRWKSMAEKPLHGNSYDFWLNYYLWEMRMYSSQPRQRSPTPATSANGVKSLDTPSMATDVLLRAMQQKGLDWPERIMEVCHQHCNDYEQSQTLRRALDQIHRNRRRVERRRAHERAAAESAYAAQAQAVQLATPGDEDGPSSKRKRDTSDEASASSKRPKNEEVATDEQSLKRDRENTSVMVRNLPTDVTVTALRKYFKDYGTVINVTTKKEANDSSALIEFESPEEMQSALLRDNKYFGTTQISVKPGTGLTIYVTNYPPTADEDYIRDLFKACGEVFSIRFPSLKYNTHRRFCYVSFEDPEGAAKATALDGKQIDGKYKLVAKYSDPSGKKKREGAVAEGRELRIKNIGQKTTEDDLRSMFEKHGKVDSIKILKNLKGLNRGTAFAVMEKKEQAESAANALNKVQLGSNILDVEVSKDTNYKPTASNKAATPDVDVEMSNGTSRPDIQARSMAILGLPDTVNDARVRTLAEEHGGNVIKIVLRPDRGGAIIEFKDPATVGKAMMALDGHEITPNQKLLTGTVDELFKEGKAQIKTSNFMPPMQVRRPVASGQKPKQRVGFAASSGDIKTEATNGSENGTAPKSNADFKAIFLGAKQ